MCERSSTARTKYSFGFIAFLAADCKKVSIEVVFATDPCCIPQFSLMIYCVS